MASFEKDIKAGEAGEIPVAAARQEQQNLHDDHDSPTDLTLSDWTAHEDSHLPSPNPCYRPPGSPASSEFDPSRGAKPYSPFYKHPTTRTSLEQLRNETSQRRSARYRMHDVENGYQAGTRPSMDGQGSTRGLWVDSRQKNSKWLGRLNRKQKFAVKALIAVIIVGTMVGIGLGISIALGGSVWKSSYQQVEIPRPG
ncbi:hypothetical protein GX48_02581 [Paracoccidioides brasiliensis]|nr:hypothetical protein GX48_02581 [Paracoccidioides brasiliensis]